MIQKIKNHLLWFMRCNRVMIRVIENEIMKFLSLALANFEMFLSFNTKHFVTTCTYAHNP